MSETTSLTTKEVARLCRVSDATVKRWEISGLIKSERTDGGHRRFRADEIARFQKDQGLGNKSVHGDETPHAASRRRRIDRKHSESFLVRTLLAGCEQETSAFLIREFFQNKSLAEIFDKWVCPAMREIGDLWFDGKINIAREHIATRTVHSAIYKLRDVLPIAEPVEKLVFCCAFEGDFHELPTYLSQMTFENLGWETVNFGSNTPLFSLIDEVSHYSPDLICISATIIKDYERTIREYAEFRARMGKLKIPIVLGGKIFDDERIRQRFPAELHAKSFSQVEIFTKSLSEK